ncbi:gamma-glutamylcyclotransferase-like [Anneissia japonica]|uniref:gamma-glutamylcyclotransferase-like n=1 Tax=Anneissia japonica TaxID=1529436 RepID=UPI0014257D07|nr:gamma-glutamylcyclotransferase-like [Anneissia japonica]
MASEEFLYFGYASNLLRERLLLKNPSATFVAIAKLEDYKLVFGQKSTGVSPVWKGGVASIEYSQGDHVWGVVWKLNRCHLQTLDLQESSHEGIEVNTKMSTGEILTCRVYVMRDMSSQLPPHPNYLDIIIKGAVQNKLPPDYITMLRSVEDNGSAETTEIYLEVMKLLGPTV